ncbi:MAG: InlB B-repeat-containing protein [Deltaproteobacteria bacterium]|nr:InlB B-repeat-containing protein [Deltaproteobacteria bacterium]
MKRNKGTIIVRSAIMGLICLLLFGVQIVWAGNIDATYKYAWGENAGWHNWRSTNAQATVEATYLTGYVWAENIGWIKLGVDAAGPYDNTDETDWGVNKDGSGNLSGYAWSENVGWINFNPTNGGVTISTSTNKFDGYAWGERIGWIHFQNDSPEYYVMQELIIAPAVTTEEVTGVGTATAIGNGTITDLGSPDPTAHGVCWNTSGNPNADDDDCTDEGLASTIGSFTSNITGLSAGTTYYVRAYATNTAGTSYGEQVEFKTQVVLTMSAFPAASGTTEPPAGSTTNVDAGEAQNITASAAPGYHFDNWTADPAENADFDNATVAFTTVTLTGSATVTANFAINTYTLTTAANPVESGTVVKDPDKANYEHGEEVQVTATAEAGYTFTGWTGDLSGTNNPASLAMDGDKTVTANFAATYTVTYDGNGNTGGAPPEDGSAYQEGTEVTVLDAGSLVKTGYTFDNWNTASDGGGTPYAPGETFSMPGANVTLYAQWTAASTRYVCRDGYCGGKTPCDMTIQQAIEAADTGTVILIADGTYDETISLNADKVLTLQGGWDASFGSQTGTTTLKGAPKAPQGSLTLQELVIKPE